MNDVFELAAPKEIGCIVGVTGVDRLGDGLIDPGNGNDDGGARPDEVCVGEALEWDILSDGVEGGPGEEEAGIAIAQQFQFIKTTHHSPIAVFIKGEIHPHLCF